MSTGSAIARLARFGPGGSVGARASGHSPGSLQPSNGPAPSSRPGSPASRSLGSQCRQGAGAVGPLAAVVRGSAWQARTLGAAHPPLDRCPAPSHHPGSPSSDRTGRPAATRILGPFRTSAAPTPLPHCLGGLTTTPRLSPSRRARDSCDPRASQCSGWGARDFVGAVRTSTNVAAQPYQRGAGDGYASDIPKELPSGPGASALGECSPDTRRALGQESLAGDANSGLA